MKYQLTWDHLNLMHRILTLRMVEMAASGVNPIQPHHVRSLSKVGQALTSAAFKKGPPITFLKVEPEELLFISSAMNRAQLDPETYQCTEGNDPQVLESIQQMKEYDELDVKVGDRVRNFHFPHGHSGGFQLEPHEHACYIEGTVLAIGMVEGHMDCNRYTIQVEREVFGGKEVQRGERLVYPPVNGTRIIGGLEEVADGVRKLD